MQVFSAEEEEGIILCSCSQSDFTSVQSSVVVAVCSSPVSVWTKKKKKEKGFESIGHTDESIFDHVVVVVVVLPACKAHCKKTKEML